MAVELGGKQKPFHHGALREALLAAALDAVVRFGIDSLSMRELARTIGVSHGAPYRHFANKEEMLIALGVMGLGELRDRLRSAWVEKSQGKNGLARLKRVGWAYLQFAADEPALFRLIFSRELSDRVVSEELRAVESETFEALHDAVSHAKEALGTSSGPAPQVTAMHLWAGLHGLAHLWVEGRLDRLDALDQDVVEFLDDALDRLLKG